VPVISGPQDPAEAGGGRLRAGHADREQVIEALKDAFTQGRLTKDELDTRTGQVYAARTYTELAEVTADIPAGLTRARPPRDPWRATKVSWLVVYALILPGLFTAAVLPGGPAPTTGAEVATWSAVVYAIFWIFGISVMIAARRAKPSAGQPPPRSAPAAGQESAPAS
jgi:DUF1707 SHOCT-like domain